MPIAVQEDMLLGRTTHERFENAKALGADGIEVWGQDLHNRVHELMEASKAAGLPVAAINHGRQSCFLHNDPQERYNALAELRASMNAASDLGAKGVIFVPIFGAALLPDLMPWKTAVQLEAELLLVQLNNLADLADAMDIELYVEPINRYETHFLNRLEQAAQITRKLGHPRVKIVADVFHMALEEDSLAGAIQQHAADIGHVHLADSNRRLPGQGTTDFAAIGTALQSIGYQGWAAYEPGAPSQNAQFARQYAAEMPASMAFVRTAGII